MRRRRRRRGRGELWRHTAPYRGLAAMTEADSDFFFGRDARDRRSDPCARSEPGQAPGPARQFGRRQILARAGRRAGGAGRQAWPEHAADAVAWPAAFHDSRRWCFLTCGRASSRSRLWSRRSCETWQFDASDPAAHQAAERTGSNCCSMAKATLADLLDADRAPLRRNWHQPKPPAFFLYIDQGEELYVRAEERAAPPLLGNPGAWACRSAPARADEPAGRFLRRVAE